MITRLVYGGAVAADPSAPEDDMSQPASEFSLEELRARIKAAGVAIPEERQEMIRKLLGDALRPIRSADWRADNTLEPAVTFDAAGAGGGHGH
jgi:hypothetical protein